MKIKLPISDNLKISLKEIDKFIGDANSQESSVFRNAIINLMSEAYREIDKLISMPTDITFVSISTRNIIETYLISRHVFTDEKWLNHWIGQLHKDAIDVQNGFLELMKKHNKDPSELEAIQQFSVETLEQSDYESKSGFNMRELAERYGHEEDYLSVHKLCSKLIHPTSMKVNAYDSLTANENYSDTLSYVASYFARQMEELIDEIRAEKFA